MIKEGIIISGFGGVGKTMLAKKYKNVIDLESSEYKYDYSNIKNSCYEKIKGADNRIVKKEYPENYINAIKEAVKEYDIVCVRYNGDEEIDFYDTYKLKYIVCYPTKNAYKNYIDRFRKRGNTEKWIQKNKKYFETAYKRCKNFKGEKILLHGNETLEDALIKRKYNLISK